MNLLQEYGREVNGILLQLRFKGVIRENPGNYYKQKKE